MTIIIAVVVFWTCLMLGALVGMSMHREATRRKRRHLRADRDLLEHDRAALEQTRRALDHQRDS